jgi:cellobiose-specific phosphotransferase system component IIB
MTDVRQHQEPVRHAQEAAEQAILLAQKAEHNLQASVTTADPQSIHSAQAAVVQAITQVEEAHNQLQTFDNEATGPQIEQTLEQLDQSLQDLEQNRDKVHTPRQIR